jgi:hypothetical protein
VDHQSRASSYKIAAVEYSSRLTWFAMVRSTHSTDTILEAVDVAAFARTISGYAMSVTTVQHDMQGGRLRTVARLGGGWSRRRFEG